MSQLMNLDNYLMLRPHIVFMLRAIIESGRERAAREERSVASTTARSAAPPLNNMGGNQNAI